MPTNNVHIVAVGDMHFKASNARQTAAAGAAIVDAVRAAAPAAAVILGDVLDRHDRVDLHPLHRAIAFLSAVRDALPEASRLWVLIGNHDRPNNATFLTDEHPFTALKRWPNTVVADTPVVDTLGGTRFLLVPYVYPGRFAEALAGVDTRGVACVFAHQEFRGAKFGPAPSRVGDVYASDAPLCVSGHIHERSSPQKNILYVGSPFDAERGGKDIALVTVGRDRETVSTSVKFIRLDGVPRCPVLSFESPGAFIEAVAANTLAAAAKIRVRCESAGEFAALVKENAAVRAAVAASGAVVVPRYVLATAKTNSNSRKQTASFLDALSAAARGAATDDVAGFLGECFPAHEFARRRKYTFRRAD